MKQETSQTSLSFAAEIKLYYDVFIPENIRKPGAAARRRSRLRRAQTLYNARRYKNPG
ncbi:MAG: hypothetical protein JWN60_372 [Acidobacteria bacterium]|nr:hypothetical protein [Acidobacteriota bacterium]